jgi:hypothetical protein
MRWLAAAAFLFVSVNAITHELEHALEHHDEPSCALHIFADHLGKPLASATFVVASAVHIAIRHTGREQAAASSFVIPFRSRAPPLSA